VKILISIGHLRQVELSFRTDRKAFPPVFIQDVESSERPAIVGSVMHKVIRPEMVAILWTQSDA
jgi:hypothetical protein